MQSITSAVIVPTRNRLAEVCSFLHSLRGQDELPSELIIIDSSDIPIDTSDQFRALFGEENFPEVSCIYKHTDPGLTYQRNVGIQVATADVIHFFDDDVLLEPDYIAQMNRTFRAGTYLGGMGTVTEPSKRRLFNSLLRKVFLLQRDHANGKFTFSGMPTQAYGTYNFREVEVLGGCCMSFTRATLLEESFDEHLRYYSYMEDCDIAKRVSKKGRLFYNPAARLDHKHSPLNRDKIEQNRAMYIKNYSYLFFKNFYPENRLRIFGYVWSLLGLFLEAACGRNRAYLRGYARGLCEYWHQS